MRVKDKIVSWFIRNVILPRQENIDISGYITEEITEEGKRFKIRDIGLPESLFIDLERLINKKYKETGCKILYSIGKKFSYRYGIILNLPTVKTISEKKFISFTNFLIKYLEAVYAKRISYEMSIEEGILKLYMDCYIVCSKNGLGYIMTSGRMNGIWAYALQDSTVEGVQIKCQGKGDAECEVICAPAKVLKKMGLKFFEERNLEGLELDKKYLEINKIRPTKYAKNSLKNLIDSGFFEYKHGIISFKGERFLRNI